MKAATREALVVQLIHLGAMPGEAEIAANVADNTLPAGASFSDAIAFVRKRFGI